MGLIPLGAAIGLIVLIALCVQSVQMELIASVVLLFLAKLSAMTTAMALI